MRACDNCLRVAEGRTWGDAKEGKLMVTEVPVGGDKGGQMNSYREKVDLCTFCASYLEAGDFCGLMDRHQCLRQEETDGNES